MIGLYQNHTDSVLDAYVQLYINFYCKYYFCVSFQEKKIKHIYIYIWHRTERGDHLYDYAGVQHSFATCVNYTYDND